MTAGAAVTINFNNKDTVSDNFALYNSSSTNPPVRVDFFGLFDSINALKKYFLCVNKGSCVAIEVPIWRP